MGNIKKMFLKDILPNDKKKKTSAVVDKRLDINAKNLRNNDSVREDVVYYSDNEELSSGKPGSMKDFLNNYNQSQSFEISFWRRYGVWFLAIITLIALFLAISFLFARANIVIKPKIVNSFVDTKIKIVSSDCNCERDVRDVSFELVQLDKDFDKKIPADAEKYVERKASGNIIIYNNYSKTPMRLIKNTRFETPTGLIYRISDSVQIPGYITKDGKKVPGSVEVKVYADFAGPEYNIGFVDFTIPGYKSYPAIFTSTYARSKTAMTGGFVGNVKTVSDQKLTEAKTALKKEAEDALRQEIDLRKDKKASDRTHYLASDLVRVFVGDIVVSDTMSEKEVVLNVRGSLVGINLNEQELDLAILKSTKDLSGIEDEEISKFSLKDKNNLSFSLTKSYKDGMDLFKSLKEEAINLKGSVQIVSNVNEQEFMGKVKGKSKKGIENIIQNEYPEIVGASISFRPFWYIWAPKNENKIDLSFDLE